MSSRGSRGFRDLEGLSEELLDYEPEGVESGEDNNDNGDVIEEQPPPESPKPSGQEYQESATHTHNGSSIDEGLSSETVNFSSEIQEIKSSSINFRSYINYHNMHVGERSSWRSSYGLHSEGSQSCRLDSSDEEDIEVETSFEKSGDEFDTNDKIYFTKNTVEDENYLGPESPTQSESLFHDGDEESSSCDATVKNNIVIAVQNQNGQGMPARKPPPLVVSFQSIGQRQVNSTIINPEPPKPKSSVKKTKKKKAQRKIRIPWDVKALKLMSVVRINSNDSMVKFIPATENRFDDISLNSQNSENSSLPSLFKIPLKRPPTRLKIKKGLSVSPVPIPSVPSICEEEIDDTISLIASTNIEEEEQQENFANFESVVEEEPENRPASPTATEGYRAERLINWLDLHGNEGQQKNHIHQIDYVPSMWRGLCFNYFFDDNCQLYNCKHSHEASSKIAIIRRLNEEELIEAYKFAKEIPGFFRKIYKVFAKVFAEKDMKNKLIDMVRVVFEEFLNTTDQIEGLTVALEALTQTDLATFKETVEYLLLQVGLQAYPSLGNILLEVIAEKQEVPQYWPLIKRLIITGEKIPKKLGSKFLTNLMRSPVDVKVCREFYQHMLKYKCLDLTLVSGDIMQPFLRICQDNTGSFDPCLDARIERNLSRERSNFEKEKLSQIHISEIDFSKPPPNLMSLKRGNVHQFGRPVQFKPPFNNLNTTRTVGENFNFFPLRNSGQGESLQARLFADDVENSSLAESQNTTRSAGMNFDLFPSRNSNQGDCQQPRLRLSAKGVGNSSYTGSISDCTNDHLSDADSSEPLLPQKRAAPNFQYNREGLEYDPTNDYLPPLPKRKVPEASDFDRLKQGVSTNKGQTTVVTENQYVPTRSMQAKSANKVVVVKENHRSGIRVVQMSGGKNDGAVSSSSDARLAEQKPPEHPQFGKLYFDPNYEFNKSLHNLYLPRIDNVDMDIEDVRELNDCVKAGNGKVFLRLVDKYKEPPTVQNFISMTLAHLRGTNQMIATTYEELLQSIEKETPNFFGKLTLRVVLEVITMNLLFELDARNMFKEATNFLCKFSNWDSLVTSRLFINTSSKEVSIIGRYLFIAKILIWTKPELTYEILLCPTLHLLSPYYNWPYHPPCPNINISAADLTARNNVLTNFLREGYLLNIVTVIDLYKTAFRKKIWEFEVKWFVNPMVTNLINRRQIVSLKHIYSEFNLFVTYFEKYTLRAFLVTMHPHLPTRDLNIIYDRCVEKNIYPRLFKGEVMIYQVVIKTNMLQCELELIVQYFFNKLVELKHLPPDDECLKFEIQLPGDDKSSKLFPILNANKSLVQTKELLTEALFNFYKIQCRSSTSNCVLIVEKSELIKYLTTLWT